MPLSIIPTFLIYAFITAITPGPANLASLSAGIIYGRGPALKQWRGLFTGFFIISMLSVIVTYFFGTLFNKYVGYLSWIGAAYILWMAWHIWHSPEITSSDDKGQPSFLRGLFVQLTNVKIMVTCLTILATFVLPYSTSFVSLLIMGLFLPFTGPVANLVWLFTGVSLQKIFANHRKAVNTVMALSLVACAISLVYPF